MTPDELTARTKQHVGNRTTLAGTTIDDTWYIDRVNHGYRRLATFQGLVTRPDSKQPQMRTVRFFELEDRLSRTIAASITDNFVAYQSGTFAMHGLWDNLNNRRVERRSSRDLMERDPDDTGEIIMWAPGGSGGSAGYRIWKRPTLDTAVYEYVYKYPETLSTGGSAPVIPAEWHDGIHLAAGALAAVMLKMYDEATRLDTAFRNFIAERRSPYEEARSGGPRTTYVGPAY